VSNGTHLAILENFAVVLHRPHFPENIGSAARACKNMGISRLVVVDPLNCDLTRILTMATHAAEDIVANMEVYDDLEEALGNSNTSLEQRLVRDPIALL
jgi:tRNA/rRNA methyltransferase